MRRIMLVIAYDGTNYSGWQIQPNAVTVEQKVNEAVSDLFGCEIAVIGASRTDAGVHAMGQVAVFDVETMMDDWKIAYALNQRLPEDIIVQESAEVDPEFHPRYAECEKTYEYKIYHRNHRNPLKMRDTYFYYKPLDVDKMRRAAGDLVGQHDFKSFCAVKAQVKSTVRTIYSCSVLEDGDVITIRICGNGFLYNMVRIIAGTLIQIGSGKIPEDAIPAMLAARDREVSGPTAPPEGLTLMEIEYY